MEFQSQCMVNKSIAIVLVILFPGVLFGQDLIYKNNQPAAKAEIIKWDNDLIQYRSPGQTDTLIHLLSTWYVDSILFDNGEVVRFKEEKLLPEGYREIKSMNFVGFGLADPIAYSNLRFTYERYLGKGNLSVFIPVSLGLTKNSRAYNEAATSIHAGAGINFHVPGKRNSRFYNVGLGIRVGQYRGINWLVGTQRPPLTLYNYWGLVNLHSINIPIRRVILVPGIDFHLLGRYDGEFRFMPFGYDFWPVFRLDIVYHF